MNEMTTEQRTAFEAANSGQAFTAADVGVSVVSVAVVMLIFWLAWVAISAYQSLRNPGTNVSDAAGKLVRAVFVVMVAIAVMNLNWDA